VIYVTDSVDITISYSIKKCNAMGGGRHFLPPNPKKNNLNEILPSQNYMKCLPTPLTNLLME
jgi:hypothetical protein